MNDLNSVLIEGALTCNAEFRVTDIGTSICEFSMASECCRESKGELIKEVSRFNVEAPARLVEAAKNQAKKGSKVRVVGKLKQYRVSCGTASCNDTDDMERQRVVIIAEHIEFKPYNKKSA